MHEKNYFIIFLIFILVYLLFFSNNELFIMLKNKESFFNIITSSEIQQNTIEQHNKQN